MINVEKERKKKENLLKTKDLIYQKLDTLVRENLEDLQHVLEISNGIDDVIDEKWIDKVVLLRTNKWLSELDSQSKQFLMHANVFLSYLAEHQKKNKNFSMFATSINSHLEDGKINYKTYNDLLMYQYCYSLLLEKVNGNSSKSDISRIDSEYYVEASLNLNNGSVVITDCKDELSRFDPPFTTKKYNNINSFLEKEVQLQLGTTEIKFNIFKRKTEEGLLLISEIMKLEEYQIEELISYKYLKDKEIFIFISNEDCLSNIFSNYLDDKINLFMNEIINSKFSIKAKALITNILLVSFPSCRNTIDLSFFKDNESYYYLKWIEDCD